MIPFAPGVAPQEYQRDFLTRMLDVVRAGFILAQSAQDVAIAIADLFDLAPTGSQTLSFGTAAPDGILSLTPTHYLVTTAPDGKRVVVLGWETT